ncbi:MAG TPA: hypothetical protein VGM27_14285 [Acidobacteriaceae bacterium]|jgi:hypothetical protein
MRLWTSNQLHAAEGAHWCLRWDCGRALLRQRSWQLAGSPEAVKLLEPLETSPKRLNR